MFFFDIWYLIFLAPGLILAAWASYRVKSAYADASRIPARGGVSGADAARVLLDRSGIPHGRVVPTQGFLSDHYVPGQALLRLSPAVYQGHSLAALGIAAHEAGHAFQDAKRYPLLVIRNGLVPLASIGSNMAWISLFIGLLLQMSGLVLAGVILFSLVVFFQVVNLPVEFDASRRAKLALVEHQIVPKSEMGHVNKVLNAAALTYVAATLQAILTLAYYILRYTQDRD
ncbi:MAG: zinc metallopeptidase [Planctomycetales bacterium]|nr:zinc metallopeptidase [Planctomycetales bacterium]